MRSNLMKLGLEKYPHRSLLKAMGLTDREIDRPIIGIANSFNEIIPGHIHLDKIAQAVKAGVRMAGGTPMEFGVIGVCDGLAMDHAGHEIFPGLPGTHRRLHRNHGHGPSLGRPGPGAQLRQDHPGHAHGGPAAQYPRHPDQRRPHAGRPLQGPGSGPDHGLRRRGRGQRPARSAKTSSRSWLSAPAPAAAPAPACSRPTP